MGAEVTVMLLDARARVDCALPNGKTPLSAAQWYGNTAVCTLLLAHTAKETKSMGDAPLPADAAAVVVAPPAAATLAEAAPAVAPTSPPLIGVASLLGNSITENG